MQSRAAGRRRRLVTLLKLLVGLGLLAALLWGKLDAAALGACFRRVSAVYWAGSIVCILCGVWISSVKLTMLLKVLGCPVPLGKMCVVYLIGIFWGNFLPGTVGGDLVKFVFIQHHTRRRMDALVALFTERFTGLLALMQVAVAGAIFYRRDLGIDGFPWLLLLLDLLLLAVAWLVRVLPPRPRAIDDLPGSGGGKVVDLVRRARLAGHLLGRHNRAMIGAGVTSFLFVVFCILVSHCFALGLHAPIGFAQMATTVALVQLATMLPLSLNGIGVREWAYFYFLAKFGVGRETAVAISLMTYMAVLAVSVIGGLLFVKNQMVGVKINRTH